MLCILYHRKIAGDGKCNAYSAEYGRIGFQDIFGENKQKARKKGCIP